MVKLFASGVSGKEYRKKLKNNCLIAFDATVYLLGLFCFAFGVWSLTVLFFI
jgi:hypothetical protein